LLFLAAGLVFDMCALMFNRTNGFDSQVPSSKCHLTTT